MTLASGFPINRRHQRMATRRNAVTGKGLNPWFPINRRHQRMATLLFLFIVASLVSRGFQSIGVTKEWRLEELLDYWPGNIPSFQSIGDTKEWRPPYKEVHLVSTLRGFQSIGVTIERRLPKATTISPAPPTSFQSIGVTKEWRLEKLQLEVATRNVSNQ